MLRYFLLAAFIIVVGVLGYKIADLYLGYKALSDVPETQLMGNAQGDLTVIEFLDYNCTYCKQAHPTISRAIKRDGQIKYIIRPVAFMSEDSVTAIKLLYAAEQQGRFAQMHDILMNNRQPLSDKAIDSFALQLDLDLLKLKQDMESDLVDQQALENAQLFEKLGVQATPSFFIGYNMRYTPEGRMPDVSDFIRMFAEARDLGL